MGVRYSIVLPLRVLTGMICAVMRLVVSTLCRDLKPENLLLADHSAQATLKIADFGFSTLLQELVSGCLYT